MSIPGVTSFDLFYAAANRGKSPFPWQSKLAVEVVTAGWPGEIGVPTGLGKTACLDIAVWSLASQASLSPAHRTLPTRTWYVVNRRLLVDAAYDRGCLLAELLARPELVVDPDHRSWWSEAGDEHVTALRSVADALRTIRAFGGEDDDPLVVTRLRGGAELGARPPHPAQPALVFATVPMFGSTWLFRGYASSRAMRSVDAAHAGIDTLVLIDEAHLSRPLGDLGRPLQQCDVGDPAAVVNGARSRPRIVSLTATGDAEAPFALDEEDHANDLVRQRLDAVKRVRLVGERKTASKLAPALVRALEAELADCDGPGASVVFANTAVRARELFDELDQRRTRRGSPLADADLLLLTGRMRRREAERVRDAVLNDETGAPSGRDRSLQRDRHLVVVATQTLEVGADLDFDVLVTESCGARALIQRLGRLNRLGDSPRGGRGAIVHPLEEKDWPLYGSEPSAVWERLTRADDDGDGIVDLPPASVSEAVGEPQDRPARVAELLPAHLWEWAKTTVPPPGEASVELFFEGFDTEGPRVTFCWRATRLEDGDRLVPSVVVDETVDVPFREARAALVDRFSEDATVMRLRADRVTVEEVPAQRVRPNDVMVLPTSAGLYDANGWSPTGRAEVLDVSLERWPGLPLDVESLRHWLTEDESLEEVTTLIKQVRSDDDSLDLDELVAALRDALDRVTPRPEVADAWTALLASVEATVGESDSIPMLPRRAEDRRWRETLLIAADAFDDLSAQASSQRLGDHLTSVGVTAAELGRGIGLPEHLVAAVEAAGRFHDMGKADPRFQRWLDPRDHEPLAKSSTPRSRWRADRAASGWPAGGRHEALSARLVSEWLEHHGDPAWDRDLVVHLILSHHGFGRPLVPPAPDRSPTSCSWDVEGSRITVSGDLAVADWDQPARFHRCCERYGYWGLALLEAVLRQADHMASSVVSGERPGVA